MSMLLVLDWNSCTWMLSSGVRSSQMEHDRLW
jgi:hypothetical protein